MYFQSHLSTFISYITDDGLREQSLSATCWHVFACIWAFRHIRSVKRWLLSVLCSVSERKPSGRGSKWGPIIVLSPLLYFHNRWRRWNRNQNWISMNGTALTHWSNKQIVRPQTHTIPWVNVAVATMFKHTEQCFNSTIMFILFKSSFSCLCIWGLNRTSTHIETITHSSFKT